MILDLGSQGSIANHNFHKLPFDQPHVLHNLAAIAEVFYYYYGLSIITSNVCHIILVMKTKTMVFPMKWYFKNNWHLYSRFVLKASLFTFCLETFILDILSRNNTPKINNYLMNIWQNNWHSKKPLLMVKYQHFFDLQPHANPQKTQTSI